MNRILRFALGVGLAGLAGIRCALVATPEDRPAEEAAVQATQALQITTLGTSVSASGETVAVGDSHVCAVLNSGSALKCWGNNSDGRLGIGYYDRQTRGDGPGEMGDALQLIYLAPFEVPDIGWVASRGATTCASSADKYGVYYTQC